MSLRSTIRAFDEWRWAGRSVVLVTVIETRGSTYSKAGHRMVIADNGDYHGLVSGGCLEGDLAEHARAVFADGAPRVVTYDLSSEADELWGLGVGCDGWLQLLLQRLDPANHYAPFLDIAECHRSLDGGRIAVVTQTDRADMQAGAGVLDGQTGRRSWGLDPSREAAIAGLLADPPATPRQVRLADRSGTVLLAPVPPIPRLLVLGAGADAVPLLRMARDLGWSVTVADHRPAYLRGTGIDSAEERIELRAGELAASLDPAAFHAAVLMTHHLDTDRAHLAELATSGPGYVGLLGPRARRDRLLADIGPAASALASRLHAPVGLALAADSAETIALAILAEIQQYLAEHSLG